MTHPFKQRQNGAVLLIVVLLLVALSLLALVAGSDSLLQSRMAAHATSRPAALHQAEAAAAWAESWLMRLPGDRRPSTCQAECGNGEVIRAAGHYPATPELEDGNWWAANAWRAGEDPGGAVPPSPDHGTGRWLIEELHVEPGPSDTVAYYRILARAEAPGAIPAAVIESLVARPWGHPDWQDEWGVEPGALPFCRRLELALPCGRVAWQQRR